MDATIDAIRVGQTVDGPITVAILAVEDDPDVVPIFIGIEEATSIARGMEATDIGRPLTHDLLLDVMEELGGRVTRCVVSDLRDNTFIADLHVQTPRDEVVVDARPSDALALAVRTNAPIEIADGVFEEAHQSAAEFEDLTDLQEVEFA